MADDPNVAVPQEAQPTPITQPAEPVQSATPATPEVQTPAPPTSPFADRLRSLGVQLPSGADDAAAQATLVRQLHQLQQQSQAYQQVVPHLDAFRKWQEQQQKAQVKQGFAAPEWNPEWRHLVRRDEAGNLVPAPGAPADIVQKIQAWTGHSTQVFDKFAANPADYLMKDAGLEEKLQQLIDARFADSFTKQQSLAQAKQIEQEVSGWAYQRDASGNPITDPMTGGPVYSAHGQFYLAALQRAQAAGISNPLERDAFAKGQLALAVMENQGLQQTQQQSITQQNQDLKHSFLTKQAARPAASPTPGAATPAQPTERGARGLQRELEQQFKKNGFDLSAQLVGR